MSPHIKSAVLVAGRRAFDVWWAGALCLVFWAVLITLGPVMEARLAPVISGFRLLSVSISPDNVATFRAVYGKSRDCDYRGMAWFKLDDEGRAEPVEVRALPPSSDPRPLGQNVSTQWTLTLEPQPRVTRLFAVVQHSCGFPWQSRSPVGPITVVPIP
jgi:hypothetical protein